MVNYHLHPETMPRKPLIQKIALHFKEIYNEVLNKGELNASSNTAGGFAPGSVKKHNQT